MRKRFLRRLYYYGVFGAFGFFIGQGILVMWPEWSAYMWWALALACLPLLAVPTLWDQRNQLRAVFGSPIFVPAWLVRLTIFFAASVALIAVVWWFENQPKHIWVHPTLSDEERSKAVSNCRMKSYDAIGGGGSMSAREARSRYARACMTNKGFRLVTEFED